MFNINSATTRNIEIKQPGDYRLEIVPRSGTVSVAQNSDNLPSFNTIVARVRRVVALGRGSLDITTTGGSVDVDVYLDKINN